MLKSVYINVCSSYNFSSLILEEYKFKKRQINDDKVDKRKKDNSP